jgi:hypothetical protein
MTVQRGPGVWFKSSYSPDKADCVEVRLEAGVDGLDVRDSKDPVAGEISVPGASWRALLSAVAGR